jgi:hypothetical protein
MRAGSCYFLDLSLVVPLVMPAPLVIPAKAGILSSQAAKVRQPRRSVLDRPVEPDDDGGFCR